MEASERRNSKDDDGVVMKTIRGAKSGFVVGAAWGAVEATGYDVRLPHTQRRVALPGLIRTLRIVGTHGFTCAAIAGASIGAEQLLLRGKGNFVHGAYGASYAAVAVVMLRAKRNATIFCATPAPAPAPAVPYALIKNWGTPQESTLESNTIPTPQRKCLM